MNSTINESIAPVCDYCGRENPHRLRACAECGTRLASDPPQAEPEPKPKSKGLAIVLAFLFGPLGLLYVGAWWPAFLMIAFGAPFIITHTGGLWLSVGGRIISAAWAYYVLLEQDRAPNPNREATRLLEEAARLESVDRAKAVAAYEEVIRLYPDTPASREAARNIQTLNRQT